MTGFRNALLKYFQFHILLPILCVFLWEIFTFNFYFFLGWLKKRGHNNKKMLKEIVESEDDESIRADYL